MSRIGKKPVTIPAGITVEFANGVLQAKGASGSLSLQVHPDINVEIDKQANQVVVTRNDDDRFHRAMHGTTRALIANMFKGLTEGFKKGIKIYGTGYGVKVQGSQLSLTVGYASAKTLNIPQGVTVDIKTPNARGNDVPAEFTISSADKYSVGQFAAEIRQVRPPEPYLGKGIRYADEVVKRKVGKAFGSGG